MYTEEDLNLIRAQQKRRWLVLGVIAVIVLAAIVCSLVIRLEVLTTALTILLGVVLIFGYEMTIRPLYCYAVHLNNTLHGRTRQLDGVFRAVSEDISLVDGVRYHAMTVSEEEGDEPCDRLFYFDAEKPFPQLADGDRVHVVYHDREVAALTRI